jgi:transposase
MVAEGEMIKVDEREKIRRAYFREGKSIRQIAREQRHSRTTVKNAIESAEEETYTLRGSREAPVLGPYKARIDELLAENERLPRKQRYTGYKIYEDIYERGYRGSESGVRRYIGLQRRETKKRKVYIPLEFDEGTDGQVDWGEAQAIIAGEQVTVQLFLMRLCYSRKLFVRAYPTQRQEAFFEGHIQAFQHFQGYMRNRQVSEMRRLRLDGNRYLGYTSTTQRKRGKPVAPAMVFPRFSLVGLHEAQAGNGHRPLAFPSTPGDGSDSLPRTAVA